MLDKQIAGDSNQRSIAASGPPEKEDNSTINNGSISFGAFILQKTEIILLEIQLYKIIGHLWISPLNRTTKTTKDTTRDIKEDIYIEIDIWEGAERGVVAEKGVKRKQKVHVKGAVSTPSRPLGRRLCTRSPESASVCRSRRQG